MAPVDAAYDGSLGVRTAWSWANEWGTVGDDNIDYTETFRYTKSNLVLKFTDEAACINVSYIKIAGGATGTPTTGDLTSVLPISLLAIVSVTVVAVMKKKSVTA